jgi:anti-sigma factor RsiW
MTLPERPAPECPSAETLAAFVDARLTAAESREVAEHLATCDSCLETVSEMHALRSGDGAGAEIVRPDSSAAPPDPIRGRRQ